MENVSEKILIGIVTRNDETNLKTLLANIDNALTRCYKATEVLVVNDGTPYKRKSYYGENVIQNEKVKHNSACYNTILRHAVNNNIQDIFLVNDNTTINPGVFEKYIETAKASKLPLLTFGFLELKDKEGKPHSNILATINYTADQGINLHQDTTGTFSYVNSAYVNEIGYFDERFKSVLEWADYVYRGCEKNFCPPWAWFPDIIDSNKYISVNKSNDILPLLRSRIMHAAALFKHKWSVLPEQIPVLPLESVKATLKIIFDKNIVNS